MTLPAKQYELRELGIGEIYGQSLAIVFKNISTLVVLMVSVYVPFYLATYFIAQAVLPPEPTTLEELAAYSQVVQQFSTFVGLLETLIIVPVTAAAVMFLVAGLYAGKRVTIGMALSLAAGRLLPLLFTYILTTLAITAGLIALIIPGIVLLVWFLLSTEVTVFEGLAGPKAMGRSKELMRGASASLILLLIGYGITFAAIRYAGSIAFAQLPPLPTIIGIAIIQAICVLLLQVGWVLYYFSARCRNETFTSEMLAECLVLEGETRDELSTQS